MAESNSTPATAKGLLGTLVVRFTLVLIFLGALLFGTAGSLQYWNGWLFMAALFLPMLVVSVHLYRKRRALLEKRLNIREKEKAQKSYVVLSLLWFLISFAIPGFDFRYGWSQVPLWLVAASVIVMLAGYALTMAAMLQNSYASRVIEIQEDQRLIDTGLYSVVRHPMYMASTIMYIACPLVLGSYYALIPTLLLPPLLVYRLLNEEKVLRTGLPGYVEYANRVKYRLIPFVW